MISVKMFFQERKQTNKRRK